MSLCARALCAQTALATAATTKASSEAVVLCALKELAQLLQQARATPPCDPPPRAVAPVDASYYNLPAPHSHAPGGADIEARPTACPR